MSIADLRKFKGNIRNNLDFNLCKNYSLIICDKIIDFISDKIKFKKFILYSSVNNEVILNKLIDFSFQKNISLFFPKISKNEMKMYGVDSLSDLSNGYSNILEPKNLDIELKNDYIDMIVVPGVVFDKSCNRIGMGKGYYDRFLSTFKKINFVVGVCYEDQLVDNIDAKETDVPMDIVITENNIYYR